MQLWRKKRREIQKKRESQKYQTQSCFKEWKKNFSSKTITGLFFSICEYILPSLLSSKNFHFQIKPCREKPNPSNFFFLPLCYMECQITLLLDFSFVSILFVCASVHNKIHLIIKKKNAERYKNNKREIIIIRPEKNPVASSGEKIKKTKTFFCKMTITHHISWTFLHYMKPFLKKSSFFSHPLVLWNAKSSNFFLIFLSFHFICLCFCSQ